jgi:hypothetical protein
MAPPEFWTTFSIGCAAECGILVLSMIVSPALFPKDYPLHKQWLWHTTASAVFPAVALVFFALPGTWELWNAKASIGSILVTPPNIALWQSLGFSVSHFVVDGVVMAVKSRTYIKAMKKPLYMQMMAHHVLSVVLWPKAFSDSRLAFVIGYFMSTEVTNIWVTRARPRSAPHRGQPAHATPRLRARVRRADNLRRPARQLNTRWFFSELQLTGTFVLIWNAMFFISYTVFRILTIPLALWLMFQIEWGAYVASTSSLNLFLTLFCSIPFGLNIFWYSLIVKAAMKMLKPQKQA